MKTYKKTKHPPLNGNQQHLDQRVTAESVNHSIVIVFALFSDANREVYEQVRNDM